MNKLVIIINLTVLLIVYIKFRATLVGIPHTIVARRSLEALSCSEL